MPRKLLVSLLLLVGLVFASTARAHAPALTMTASSESESTSTEVTTAAGPWSFKVIGVTGRPSKVLLFVRGVGDDTVITCHPRTGRVCKSDPNQDIPAGVQDLTLRVWDGKGPSSVTIEIYHP